MARASPLSSCAQRKFAAKFGRWASISRRISWILRCQAKTMQPAALDSPFLPRVYGPRTSWVPVFLEFLSKITIISKEEAVPGPITPYEAQYRFLGELCKA